VAVVSIIACCIGDDSGDSAISVTAINTADLVEQLKQEQEGKPLQFALLLLN